MKEANPARVLVVILAGCSRADAMRVLHRVGARVGAIATVEMLVLLGDSANGPAPAAREQTELPNADFVSFLRDLPAGEGARQKVAFRIGLEAGFDFIIPLRQANEEVIGVVPRLVASWREKNADLVYAAWPHPIRAVPSPAPRRHRLLRELPLKVSTGAPVSHGFPPYQMRYRGYSTALLHKVPFDLNSNGRQFDTELLLQALHVGARIEQCETASCLPETRRHFSIECAREVLLPRVRYQMHQMGLLSDLKYRCPGSGSYVDKTDMPLSSHHHVLTIVKQLGPRTILDIGCGQGCVARRCGQLGIHVTGVDVEFPSPGTVDAFSDVDLDTDEIPADPFSFDMVLLLDIIEHLSNPERFLLALRHRTPNGGHGRAAPVFLVSTPNIAFVAARVSLLLGRFNYDERGILDVTHKRLFTRGSLLRLLRACGYEVQRVIPVPPPFQIAIPKTPGLIATRFWSLLCRVWPTLFAYQFVVQCRPTPGGLLALKASEHRRELSRTFLDLLQDHNASREHAPSPCPRSL